MAYGNFKNLTWRTASDKILRGKAFNIVKNPKNDGYQRDSASMVYTFLTKRLQMEQLKTRTCQISVL